MVERTTASLRSRVTCSLRPVLAHLRPDRAAADRRLDCRRQIAGSFPAPDAQVHLAADAARGLKAVIPSRADGEGPRKRSGGVAISDACEVLRFAQADRIACSSVLRRAHGAGLDGG